MHQRFVAILQRQVALFKEEYSPLIENGKKEIELIKQAALKLEEDEHNEEAFTNKRNAFRNLNNIIHQLQISDLIEHEMKID